MLSLIKAEHYVDGDSSFGNDDADSALNYNSVTSSIFNYRLENGRTYHAVRTLVLICSTVQLQ